MGYHIGLVSKLLDISAEGLRLYEREGILESRREGDGGYRCYERLDITSLLRARSYQKYGFPLREVGRLMNSGELDYVRRGLRGRERELEEEIALKSRLLACLRETEALTDALPEALGRIEEAESPGMYRLEFMRRGELLLEPGQYALFRRWSSRVPFVFPSPRCLWAAVERGEDDTLSALGLLERDADLLGEESLRAPGVERFPPRRCLYTVVRVSGEEASCGDYLAPLLDYVRRRGLEPAGDPIARAFLSLNKRSEYTRYRQIWLPIGS